ncbi:MAG: sugar ABC transporter permease [Candidatus Omnitrophota bacterium]
MRHFQNPTYGIIQGVNNFRTIFSQPVLKQANFFPIFLRTILWTVIQITCHVTFGLGLALLLNRKMVLRGLYRTLLIIPWAVPQVVATLAWRGEFNFEYGFINIFLRDLGLKPIQWKLHPFWNFVAVNITNIWLGIPFMMVILLGGLQSISHTYYEAADMDGAGPFSKFKNITLPLLKPIMTPAVVLGVIWTFNNFNVPYFINEYELETSDILVTALFRAAFEYNRFGFAAAFAFIIFFILLGFTLLYMKITKFDPGLEATRKKAA